MTDPKEIWTILKSEAETLAQQEPLLKPMLQSNILNHDHFAPALTALILNKLNSADLNLTEVLDAANITDAALYDLLAIRQHDPAALDMISPYLFYKGFHALQGYRLAHLFWQQNRKHLALYLQNRISSLWGVDIHPAAQVGHGIMMDHATGIVIGETAIVENDVLFWHGVTLGGKEISTNKRRHPTIREGVQLGAGSIILGDIEVGKYTRIGAGSVVTKNIPANVTAAGIPAIVIKKN